LDKTFLTWDIILRVFGNEFRLQILDSDLLITGQLVLLAWPGQTV